MRLFARLAQPIRFRRLKLLRNVFNSIGVLIVMPLLFVCLPLIVLYVTILQRMQIRRLARTSCPNCDAPFGSDEVTRARSVAEKTASENISRFIARGWRPRVSITWELHCANCGSQFTFSPMTVELEPTDATPAQTSERLR